MAIYENNTLKELPIYGSSRLGVYKVPAAGLETDRNKLTLGRREYELANHLGNVLATVSDVKLPAARVLSHTDYYAFGSAMPGRSGGAAYRYGFNGKEKADEVANGNLDFGARIYNSNIGRTLSMEPHQYNYPELSPYSFLANTPLQAIDPDGKDWILLVWQPDTKDQGHVAIAVMNYKEVKGQKIPDGSYTIYEASEIGRNELMDYVNNPKQVVNGKITVRRYNDKASLLSDKIQMEGGKRAATAAVEFKSTPEQDDNAHQVLRKMVTKYKKSSDTPVNPVGYSLNSTGDNNTFSCASFAHFAARELYKKNLGTTENVNFDGGKVLTTKVSIDVPSANLNTYTPGSLFRGPCPWVAPC
jgi:RHS repeat-associated protein